MLKLLIVDDEPMFREGLRSTVDWNSLGVEIAGEAYNGVEAMALLARVPVDLIVTDIRMPDMDGLELIEAAASLYPRLRYIVLSAFDDFRLVKRAFKLGIVDYILKSEFRESDLAEILERQAVEVRRRTAAAEYDAADYAEERNRQFVRQLLRSCVERKVPLAETALPAEYRTAAETAPVFCAVFQLHVNDYSLPSYQVDELLTDAVQSAEELIDRRPGRIGYPERSRYILFSFPGTAVSWREFSGETEKLRREIESVLNRRFASLCVSAGCSSMKHSSLLSRPKHEAERACSLYLLRGCGATYGFNRYQESLNRESLAEEPLFRRFAEFIKVRDIRGLVRNMATFQLSPARLSGASFNAVLTLFEKYHYHLLSFCEQMGFDTDRELMTVLNRLPVLTAAGAPLKELNRWLQETLEQLQSGTEGKNALVNRVIRYIQHNYHRELSLTDVADRFQVNPSYLSRVFSRHVEKGFSSYLTEIRIARAQHLLETENLRIYEVAHMVGIENPESFSRIFKRITGTAPRDYLS